MLIVYVGAVAVLFLFGSVHYALEQSELEKKLNRCINRKETLENITRESIEKTQPNLTPEEKEKKFKEMTSDYYEDEQDKKLRQQIDEKCPSLNSEQKEELFQKVKLQEHQDKSQTYKELETLNQNIELYKVQLEKGKVLIKVMPFISIALFLICIFYF